MQSAKYNFCSKYTLHFVDAVLNLCEVLRHDPDACASVAEERAISEAGDSLEQRWKSICSLITQRRIT